ncbi:MAG: hypothetical protein ACQGVC_11495 [Myxococcota bacterium]
MAGRNVAVALLAVLLGVPLAACAGWQDYDPPEAREMPEGPGVLSGADGEFAIEADLPDDGNDGKDESEESADDDAEDAVR